MAPADAVLTHIRSLELQRLPWLAEALEPRAVLDLGLAASREALRLEMGRARHGFRAQDHADSCSTLD